MNYIKTQIEQKILVITGTGLPSDINYVTVGSEVVRIKSANTTHIVLNAPSMVPGVYTVGVSTGIYGNAKYE